MEATKRGSATSWGWPTGPVAMGIRMAIRMALFLGLLFGTAGRFDWLPGWVLVAASVLGGVGIYLYVERKQPGLMERRTRIGSNTKRWDKIWLAVFFTCYFAVMVVGALDGGRWGWAPMPLWASAVGVGIMVPCYLLFGWAMGDNRHFEASVRIQRDLDHQVIDTGPYAAVRHPGYVAGVLMVVGTAVVLCSWWALLPAALASVGLVVRTALEDRTLQNELAGYVDYTRRVRFRLLPGIW